MSDQTGSGGRNAWDSKEFQGGRWALDEKTVDSISERVRNKKNSHKRAVLFHILNYGSPTRGLLAEDIESAQAGVAA